MPPSSRWSIIRSEAGVNATLNGLVTSRLPTLHTGLFVSVLFWYQAQRQGHSGRCKFSKQIVVMVYSTELDIAPCLQFPSQSLQTILMTTLSKDRVMDSWRASRLKRRRNLIVWIGEVCLSYGRCHDIAPTSTLCPIVLIRDLEVMTQLGLMCTPNASPTTQLQKNATTSHHSE